MRHLTLILFALVFAGAVHADPHTTVEDDSGTLNPPDTGREMLVRKIQMGITDSVTCSLAFNNTKYDARELAKELARLCAEAGHTKAMTWMSQLENDNNPEAAAEWDRRAAEAGDPMGRYNYGLDLMRGHGVAKDEALGRHYIDLAAKDGLETAKRFQQAGYDLDEVTPDADN